ncbi:MAG: XdhC family protein [Gemmatimonadetes bacterium]|nr:XdhC family protein [Gemmatimonadota bacterium]
MSIRAIRESLDRWERRGDRVAIATLIGVRRSAPLPPGARFALSSRGEWAGSISSGCVEGDVHERLSALLAGADPDTTTYGITDEMAADVGLSCGGEIDIRLDLHDPTHPAWVALDAALDAGTPAVLVTGVGARTRSGALALVASEATGTLGSDELDRAARAGVHEFMGRSDARVVDLIADDPDTAVFVESFVRRPRLVIVGATPIGQALSAMAARTGFEVAVVDPRGAFADPARFPEAEVHEAWPDEAMADLELDARTSVVVLTHDAKIDLPALQAALAGPTGYVGLLGGRRTQGQRRAALREGGLDEATCDRIHGPVGLDIGARTPEQIAVSVLAELIAEGRAP